MVDIGQWTELRFWFELYPSQVPSKSIHECEFCLNLNFVNDRLGSSMNWVEALMLYMHHISTKSIDKSGYYLNLKFLHGCHLVSK